MQKVNLIPHYLFTTWGGVIFPEDHPVVLYLYRFFVLLLCYANIWRETVLECPWWKKFVGNCKLHVWMVLRMTADLMIACQDPTVWKMGFYLSRCNVMTISIISINSPVGWKVQFAGDWRERRWHSADVTVVWKIYSATCYNSSHKQCLMASVLSHIPLGMITMGTMMSCSVYVNVCDSWVGLLCEGQSVAYVSM